MRLWKRHKVTVSHSADPEGPRVVVTVEMHGSTPELMVVPEGGMLDLDFNLDIPFDDMWEVDSS